MLIPEGIHVFLDLGEETLWPGWARPLHHHLIDQCQPFSTLTPPCHPHWAGRDNDEGVTGSPFAVSVQFVRAYIWNSWSDHLGFLKLPNLYEKKTVVALTNWTTPEGAWGQLTNISFKFQLLGLLCQFLLVQFGSSYAPDLGDSYTEFLVSVSSCLLTTVLLLVCYILSKNSYHLIRSSIFVRIDEEEEWFWIECWNSLISFIGNGIQYRCGISLHVIRRVFGICHKH